MPLRTSPCAKADSAAAETNGAMELMRMVLLGLTAAYYTISATMRLRWRRGHGRLHGRRRGEAHRLRRGRGGREHGRAAGARHREGHRRLPDGRFRLRGDGHRQGRRPHGALRQLTAAHSWCLRACGAGACATLVLALHQALSTKHQAPRHSRAGGQHTDLFATNVAHASRSAKAVRPEQIRVLSTRWGQSPFASCHGFTPCLCVAIVSALYTPAGAKGYTPIATLHAMA